jgi:hypothetical protein
MTSDSFISGYSLNWNPSVSGTIVLGRYVSNSVTTLDTTNIGTFSSVDQVGLRIGNGEVRAFYNGTEIMVASDSTYASGYFGILTSQTGATGFRNFGGGLTPVPSLPVAGQTSWADALNQWLMADHTSVGVNNPPYVVQRNVLLSAHGFTAGQAISLGAGGYVKAKADSASTSQVVGMVGASPLTNQFNLITQGYVRNLSGFTAGTLYYLSAATAGALTSTAPSTSGQIVKPLFIADSTTSGYFINQRGIAVP